MKDRFINIIQNCLPYGLVYSYQKNFNKNNSHSNVKMINFQVNNYCNSRCVMCGIWKNNDNNIINVKQFGNILKDEIFIETDSIGITGGEPILINNLFDYYKTAIEVLPNLRSLSIITNGLLVDRFKRYIKDISNLCKYKKKLFSVMISLDGTKEVHDKNRGIEGNFQRVIEIIDWLQNEKIPFMTGTTITKLNVWNLDELLCFMHEERIFGRFRIAEFIDRLDIKKDEYNDIIRNFNEDEIYQLCLFFTKLEYYWEKDVNVKNTYKSIRNMLLGGIRLIECPYKNGLAVNLDCHGQLSYCAPKSPIIGDLFSYCGKYIYEKNLNVLEKIKKNDCVNCIHDYHASPSQYLIDELEYEDKYKKLISISSYNNKCNIELDYTLPIRQEKYSVFIIGWYGTETVGDKAILKGIIDDYLQKYGYNINIWISSLFPFVTERTIKELAIDARIIPVYNQLFFECAAKANEVIVGGGPLMEIQELSLILWAFHISKKNGNHNLIYGCGIGPLHTDEGIQAVKEILEMSDEIWLRDTKSLEIAKKIMNIKKPICTVLDPSILYIRKIQAKISPQKINYKVSFFLRELPFDYFSMSFEEFQNFKENFERGLANNIKVLCDQLNLIPHFYAMQNLAMGADDRDFNFRFIHKYFSDRDVYVEKRLSTIDNTIEAMKSSIFNICMRFHSVVFSDTLAQNYFAIDYTTGGKIHSFLEDKGKIDCLIHVEDIRTKEDYLYKKFKDYKYTVNG